MKTKTKLMMAILLIIAIFPIVSANTLSYDSDKSTINMNYDENNRLIKFSILFFMSSYWKFVFKSLTPHEMS